MARLPESDIITPVLLQRFMLEATHEGGDGRYYAIIRRDDGGLHHPGSPHLAPEQVIWAEDVLRLLNRELHHDGAWVCVFTHVAQPMPTATVLHYAAHAEYERYALIWLDSDGDPQFTMDWHAGASGDLHDFADVMIAGIISTAQKAEAAWSAWDLHMRKVLEPKGGQTFKRAKGERPPSALH